NAADPKDGYTALATAAEEGNIEIVAWLARHGAGIEVTDKDGRTPLFAAAVAGQAEVVDYLIREAGANSDVTDGSGRHVFWACCALEQIDAAAALLDATAKKGLRRIDINAKDLCGLTALDFARQRNLDAVVDFLKARGALFKTRIVSKRTQEWELRELDSIINSSSS
ncbi:hypothetical protein CTAYLR_008220, partial [Chrysophaeum taylorii]